MRIEFHESPYLSGLEQSVYSIATERDISALVGDYRRRKNRHSLPPSQTSGTQRLNPFVIDSSQQLQQQSFRPSESVPPEIEDQRNKSLMKVKQFLVARN